MAWGTTGVAVATSKDSSGTVLFAMAGKTTIKQTETVTATEWRGLTEAAALAKCVAPAYSSDYAETTYYSNTQGDGEVHSFTAKTGTKTEWTATRTDESGQWTATERVTEYAVSPAPTSAMGWGTAQITADGEEPTASSDTSSGRWTKTSYDVSHSHIVTKGGKPLGARTATTSWEMKYLTQAAAESLVSDSASDTVATQTALYQTYRSASDNTLWSTFWVSVTTGTECHASATFVSAKEGYTVTKTQTVYSVTGLETAAYTEGWRLS